MSGMKTWKRKWKTLEKRIIAWVVAHIGQAILKLILFTCRIEIFGAESFFKAAKKGRCILMLWHNRLAPIPLFLKRCPGAEDHIYAALISKSRDGELIAKIIKRYPQGRVIRVAHDAKFQAAKKAIQQLSTSTNVICITPDGPQGPRYEIKPGVAMMARTAKAKIVPLSWSGSRFWQLKTWDLLMLPKPFSKIAVYFGAPISVSEEAIDDIRILQNQLQMALLKTDRQACQAVTSNPALWPE